MLGRHSPVLRLKNTASWERSYFRWKRVMRLSSPEKRSHVSHADRCFRYKKNWQRPCLNLQVNGSSLKPRMWTRARRLQTPAVASAPEFPHRPGENEKTTSVSEGKRVKFSSHSEIPLMGNLRMTFLDHTVIVKLMNLKGTHIYHKLLVLILHSIILRF